MGMLSDIRKVNRLNLRMKSKNFTLVQSVQFGRTVKLYLHDLANKALVRMNGVMWQDRLINAIREITEDKNEWKVEMDWTVLCTTLARMVYDKCQLGSCGH